MITRGLYVPFSRHFGVIVVIVVVVVIVVIVVIVVTVVVVVIVVLKSKVTHCTDLISQ